MTRDFVLAIIASVLSSTGGWGILQIWLTARQKRAQEEKDARQEEAEARRSKQANDSQTWYRESRNHYDVAKKEASEARADCNNCRKELEATRRVVYLLLEEFEDQIIPMLTLPAEAIDQLQIRQATRAVIRRARESLSDQQHQQYDRDR